MLKIDINIDGLKKLDRHVEFVNKMLKMKTDLGFQKYIQEKCLETVREMTDRHMRYDGPTVELYKSNHKIREISGGFELYNDTIVDAETEGYNGIFSIALAFEYGTGIVGSENPKVNAWGYNLNNHEKGWTYFKKETFHFTRGYEGMEIYRYTAEEIKKRLKYWVNSYYTSKKGA
jgi:hypothetical protein